MVVLKRTVEGWGVSTFRSVCPDRPQDRLTEISRHLLNLQQFFSELPHGATASFTPSSEDTMESCRNHIILHLYIFFQFLFIFPGAPLVEQQCSRAYALSNMKTVCYRFRSNHDYTGIVHTLWHRPWAVNELCGNWVHVFSVNTWYRPVVSIRWWIIGPFQIAIICTVTWL